LVSSFVLTIRPPPPPTPFPYTTLFRSPRPRRARHDRCDRVLARRGRRGPLVRRGSHRRRARLPRRARARGEARRRGALPREPARSEEHTSELQSHLNLVCRLLLEKKKK